MKFDPFKYYRGYLRCKKILESCVTIGQWMSAQNYITLAYTNNFINLDGYTDLFVESNNHLYKINNKS